MRFISTYIHGMLDYGMGVILLLSPWIFGFAQQLDHPQAVPGTNPQSVIPILLGIGVMVYSLFTDYEFGAVRKIPMVTHLWIDAISGLFLAASPWLFGFADNVYLPHLLLGLAEIGAALFTATAAPNYPKRGNPVR
ncbi:hypothetical protein D770_19310 [Flammeovirgaceae bacterium 311]|nr:hypothetical protein D770_19310 [Flammeovirgaceae bacterium 311]